MARRTSTKIKLTKEDRWLIIQKFIEEFGLVGHHTRSFEEFLENRIKRVIEANPIIDADVGFIFDFKVNEEEDGDKVKIDVERRSLAVESDGSPVADITPLECRIRRITYAIPINIHFAIKKVRHENGEEKLELVKKDRFPRDLLIPIIVGSKYDPHFRSDIRKDVDYLVKIGEDLLDWGGYFIINGSERVVVPREESVRGRILTEELSGSSTEARKYKVQAWLVSPGVFRNRVNVYIGRDDMKLYATFTQAGNKKPIPLILLMRALGYTIKDFVSVAAPDELNGKPKYGSDLVTNVIQLNIQGIPKEALLDQEEALFRLGEYIDNLRIPFTKENRKIIISEVKRRLNSYLLPHLGRDIASWALKGYYLARMARRVILIYFGQITAEDRDHYKNKRLKMVSDFLEELFSHAWRVFVEETKKRMTNWASSSGTVSSLRNTLRTDKLYDIMMKSIATGAWPTGVTGVTEILGRLNYIDTLSHLRRVKNILTRSSAEAKVGKVEARDLHPTQWGRICPNETPEGELCGLTKQLALTAYVSTGLKKHEKELLKEKILIKKLSLIPEPIKVGKNHWPNVPVFIDGLYVGYVEDPHDFVNKFRELRRRGEIHWSVSIKYWEKYDEIYINTDSGRILRPLIIVKNGKPAITKEAVEKIRNGTWTFKDLLTQGMVEFLDAEEEEDAYIAWSVDQITEEHTHLEVSPAAILGISAGLIPFANHDHSPKVTHETSMAKQAMGLPRPNYRIRPETSTYILHTPQKPLVTTKTADIINVDERGFGQNVMVAVLSYEGYNIEDALIINKASIERGLMRGSLFRIYEVEERKYVPMREDIITVPSENLIGRSHENYNKIAEDGITWPGIDLVEDEVVVGRVSPSTAMVPTLTYEAITPQTFKDTSEKIRKGEGGYIDQVILTLSKEGTVLVRVKLRQPRYPELGDKFASRHGQKGVIGLIVPQEDMPFDEYGMTPDIIINPHSIPSRMTVGQLLESLAGSIAAREGKQIDGTAFESRNWTEELIERAKKLGLNYYGERTLFDGKTGKIMKAYILMGPVYYQRLKHLARDKLHARSTGKVTMLTLQPTEGKARGGGLRLGEMERDALLGHGVAQFLHERFVDSSDAITIFVCDECGEIGYYNPKKKRWVCPIHGDKFEMHKVTVPYAFVLLVNELKSLAIRVKLNVEPT